MNIFLKGLCKQNRGNYSPRPASAEETRTPGTYSRAVFWLRRQAELPYETYGVRDGPGRGNLAVPDLVRGHDEVLLRIQRVLRTDVGVRKGLMRTQALGGDQGRVVPGVVNLPECRVGEMATPERGTLFEGEVSQVEHLVWALHLRRIVGAFDHPRTLHPSL